MCIESPGGDLFKLFSERCLLILSEATKNGRWMLGKSNGGYMGGF